MPAKAKRRDEVMALGAQLSAVSTLLANASTSDASLADAQAEMSQMVESIAAKCSLIKTMLGHAQKERLRVVAEAEQRAMAKTSELAVADSTELANNENEDENENENEDQNEDQNDNEDENEGDNQSEQEQENEDQDIKLENEHKEEETQPTKSDSELQTKEPAARKNTGSKTTSPPAAHGRFVPNPKAEFVAPQTQPLAALKLFGNNPGDEKMCAKLGVASYPKEDLLDLLPGPVPDQDYTQAKPPNQVQFPTFAASLEPYFRPYTEEDLAFLQQKSVGAEVVSEGRLISPYIIPPLGPSYIQQWREEDGPNPGYTLSHGKSGIDPSELRGPNLCEPAGRPSDLSDATLDNCTVQLGPLSERLLSAIIPEDEDDLMSDNDNDQDGDNDSDSDSEQMSKDVHFTATATQIPAGAPGAKQPFFASFASLEDRLQREFLYVGILDINIIKADYRKRQNFKLALPPSAAAQQQQQNEAEIDWINMAEDDEICRELRKLQSRTREVAAANTRRRRILLPIIEEAMAYQEYSTILDDLDRQVDQSYLKRLRVPKAKKKKHVAVVVSSEAQSPAANPANTANVAVSGPKSSLRGLLDKRARWITKIGSIFLPQHEMLRSHEHPKFAGTYNEVIEAVGEEDEEDEEEEMEETVLS